MKRYEIEVLDPKQVSALARDELMNNEYICETAGFEPLEVRFKRFEQQGLLQQVLRSDVTSADLREMYLNPDYSINIDDDPEDIILKMSELQKHIQDVKQQVRQRQLKADEEAKASSKARQAVSAAENAESVKETEE